MSFHNALIRLRRAAAEGSPGHRVDQAVVARRDLQNLLADFDRIDALMRQQHAEIWALREDRDSQQRCAIQAMTELATLKSQEPAELQVLSVFGNWINLDKSTFETYAADGRKTRKLYAAPVPAPTQVAAEVVHDFSPLRALVVSMGNSFDAYQETAYAPGAEPTAAAHNKFVVSYNAALSILGAMERHPALLANSQAGAAAKAGE